MLAAHLPHLYGHTHTHTSTLIQQFKSLRFIDPTQAVCQFPLLHLNGDLWFRWGTWIKLSLCSYERQVWYLIQSTSPCWTGGLMCSSYIIICACTMDLLDLWSQQNLWFTHQCTHSTKAMSFTGLTEVTMISSYLLVWCLIIVFRLFCHRYDAHVHVCVCVCGLWRNKRLDRLALKSLIRPTHTHSIDHDDIHWRWQIHWQ